MYASFNNKGTMRYVVTAPDGTCVIGANNDCPVTKSLTRLHGNFTTVTLGIRYTG